MFESFTAGALRAIERSEARARLRGASAIEPADLIAALVDEPENRAASLLDEFGLVAARLLAALGQAESLPGGDDEAPAVPQSAEFRSLLNDAANLARAFDRTRSAGTEHLLA